MTAIVRDRPLQVVGDGTISSTGILSGKPVKGPGQWQSMAELSNYVLGHGGTLIGGNTANHTCNSGASATFLYYTWPRYATVMRMWVLSIRAPAVFADGYFQASGITLGSWSIAGALSSHFIYYETVAQSNTPVSVTAKVFNNANGSSVIIEEIACYEVPRHFLTGSVADAGTEQDSCNAGNVIYDSTTYESVGGVVGNIPGGISICRRNSHFHWFDPDGVTSTTTDFTAVFVLEPEVLGRLLYSEEGDGNTDGRTLSWTVYADGGAQKDGQIKVTAISDATGPGTDTITLNTAASAWMPVSTFDVDCEDINTVDGRRGATWETLKFEVRKGESNWILYGISVGEAEP